jgi:hypothetical protein
MADQKKKRMTIGEPMICVIISLLSVIASMIFGLIFGNIVVFWVSALVAGAVSANAIKLTRPLSFAGALLVGAFTGAVFSIMLVPLLSFLHCSHNMWCNYHYSEYPSVLESIIPFFSEMASDLITSYNILFGAIGGALESIISKRKHRTVTTE